MLQFMGSEPLFKNFYYSLRKKVTELIKCDNSIKLAVISGDLGSLGHIPINQKFRSNKSDFMKFFELFYEKDIPVLTCPGNHDIFRKLNIDKNAYRKFLQYVSKIRRLELDWEKKCKKTNNQCNKDVFQKKSSRFSSDQSSYVYLKGNQIIVMATNSCKSIEMKQIGIDLKKKKPIYDPQKLNEGYPDSEELVNFVKNVKEQIGEDDFHKAYKFIITHHPITHDLHKKNHILKILKDYGVSVCFSGHLHDYDFRSENRYHLKCFTAGSPLVNPVERTRGSEGKTADLQFTLYQLYLDTKLITPIIYKYEEPDWNQVYKFDDITSYDNYEKYATEGAFKVFNATYEKDPRITNDLLKKIRLRTTTLKEIANSAYNKCLDNKELTFSQWEKYTKQKMQKKNYMEKLQQNFQDSDDLFKSLVWEGMIKIKERIIKLIK